jgi:hypothetical protein
LRTNFWPQWSVLLFVGDFPESKFEIWDQSCVFLKKMMGYYCNEYEKVLIIIGIENKKYINNRYNTF